MIEPTWLEALALAGDMSPKQLEKRFGAEASRWALLQVELRKKARGKFADASSMLFDREALEQATHEVVAHYHASCYPEGAEVVDITSGIGSDLRAFGASAVGFELDEHRAFCAGFNCPNATIRIGDGLAFAVESSAPYVWADPDRRDTSGRRLADPSTYSPDPMLIPRDRELTGIKLSPLLADEYLLSVGPRVEFVSYKGECREAVVWSGRLAEPGVFAVRVSEVSLEAGGSYSLRSIDSPGSHPRASDSPASLSREAFLVGGEAASRGGSSVGGDAGVGGIQNLVVSRLAQAEIYDVVNDPEGFIYDCDPAAVRAHALGGFGMPQLGDSPGYLTGGPVSSEWLSGYEVLASGSFDVKRIREALRGLDARVFEVKQRGAGLDPGTVMRQVKTSGSVDVSLIGWRVEKSVRYALARRV